MTKRIDLPIRLIGNGTRDHMGRSEALNTRYVKLYKGMGISTLIDKLDQYQIEGYIISIPEGKLLFWNSETQRRIWERKETKHILIDNTLYDISSDVLSRSRTFRGDILRPINNEYIIAYPATTFNIRTGKKADLSVMDLEVSFDSLVHIDITEEKFKLHEYELDGTFRHTIEIQGEFGHGGFSFARSNTGYYIIIILGAELRIYHIEGKEHELVYKDELPIRDVSYIPNRLLLIGHNKQNYTFDLTTRTMSKTNIPNSKIHYFPRYVTPVFDMSASVVVSDSLIRKVKEFDDIEFATREERLELKCMINVFLRGYIISAITNMIFQCLDTP